jgi:hypothetical protein
MAICGMYDKGILEDDWLLRSEPRESDFHVVGLCELNGLEAEFVHAWYPYRFYQTVQLETATLLYFMRWDRSSTQSINALTVVTLSHTSEPSDMLPLNISGLRQDLPVSFLDFHYDPRVGFYGCISLRQRFEHHESYLAMSADGIDWEVRHKLAE